MGTSAYLEGEMVASFLSVLRQRRCTFIPEPHATISKDSATAMHLTPSMPRCVRYRTESATEAAPDGGEEGEGGPPKEVLRMKKRPDKERSKEEKTKSQKTLQEGRDRRVLEGVLTTGRGGGHVQTGQRALSIDTCMICIAMYIKNRFSTCVTSIRTDRCLRCLLGRVKITENGKQEDEDSSESEPRKPGAGAWMCQESTAIQVPGCFDT